MGDTLKLRSGSGIDSGFLHQHFQRRGLTSTVRPEKSKDLTGFDFKCEIVDCCAVTVVFRDVIKAYHVVTLPKRAMHFKPVVFLNNGVGQGIAATQVNAYGSVRGVAM